MVSMKEVIYRLLHELLYICMLHRFTLLIKYCFGLYYFEF